MTLTRFALLFLVLFGAITWLGCSDDDYGADMNNKDAGIPDLVDKG